MQEDSLKQTTAPMLPLLIAIIFPDCLVEHAPHVVACLKPYLNHLLLPNYPLTWYEGYAYVNGESLTEDEEFYWKTISKAVNKFYLAFRNSKKVQLAIIKRFETFLEKDLIAYARLTPIRKLELLGATTDRVTVFNLDEFALKPSLTRTQIELWELDRNPVSKELPIATVGQELLELYNGVYPGVIHQDNYIIFSLPWLTYSILSNHGTWNYLPERAYNTFQFATANDFGNHYVTFRDELNQRFDRAITEVDSAAKPAILKRWCDSHAGTLSKLDPISQALASLMSRADLPTRFRVVNANELRKRILTLLNRTYIKAPAEKRAERKAYLEQERVMTITPSALVQDACRCPNSIGVSCRRDAFYVEATAVYPFTAEQSMYFLSRVKTVAPYINIGDKPFVNLRFLEECYSIGLRNYPDLRWIKCLSEDVMDKLAALEIYSVDDWKTHYKERINKVQTEITNARHTSFDRETDEKLWKMWKRYMHEDARAEILETFATFNPRHVILRGRLMSQLRRKNKTIEFLYDIEGLKKFLGKQYPTYSAVIG